MSLTVNKYSSYTDNELVARLQKNSSKTAFEELYNRYWEKLLFQALIKLNSEAEAEEVVQDVFLNLWKRRHTLEIKFTFHTYIASCVKYEILNKLAHRQKETNLKEQSYTYLKEETNTTEENINYNTLVNQIEETVNALPEKCQLVFRLSREEGLSQKQIAEKLNISPKTVETHITKALKAIRSTIGKMQFSIFY